MEFTPQIRKALESSGPAVYQVGNTIGSVIEEGYTFEEYVNALNELNRMVAISLYKDDSTSVRKARIEAIVSRLGKRGEQHKYDIFLSHAAKENESTRGLQQEFSAALPPGGRVFCDLNGDLEHLNNLDKDVENSANMVTYLNDAYIASKWCVIEVILAQRKKVKLQIVQTDFDYAKLDRTIQVLEGNELPEELLAQIKAQEEGTQGPRWSKLSIVLMALFGLVATGATMGTVAVATDLFGLNPPDEETTLSPTLQPTPLEITNQPTSSPIAIDRESIEVIVIDENGFGGNDTLRLLFEPQQDLRLNNVCDSPHSVEFTGRGTVEDPYRSNVPYAIGSDNPYVLGHCVNGTVSVLENLEKGFRKLTPELLDEKVYPIVHWFGYFAAQVELEVSVKDGAFYENHNRIALLPYDNESSHNNVFIPTYNEYCNRWHFPLQPAFDGSSYDTYVSHFLLDEKWNDAALTACRTGSEATGGEWGNPYGSLGPPSAMDLKHLKKLTYNIERFDV